MTRSMAGIGLGGEFALPRVAAGLRIERVGPNAVGRGLAVMLFPAHADRLPVSALELTPFDRNGGIRGLATTRGIIVRTTPSGAAG
jgi:hypothetical protein